MEGEEEALEAAEKAEAPTKQKQSAAQVLKKTASDERTKKQQATAEGAAAAFEKVL